MKQDPSSQTELLRKSEEFRRRLIEGSQDAIFVLDLAGRTVSIESRGLLLPEEAAVLGGTPWSAIWAAEHRDGAVRSFEQARAGSMARFVAKAESRGGSLPTYWDVAVSPLHDAAGTVDRLLVSARDVTAERRAQEDKERLTRALEETLRFGETIVTIVGHHLRNPLNAMLVGAQLLEQKLSDDASRKTVARIRSSGRRIQSTLDDLADLARARLGGGIQVQPEPASLTAVAAKAVADARTTHPERKIDLTTVGDATGLWDRSRLEQVVERLLANALGHGDPQGEVRVHLDGTREATVEFSVHNAGGIPPDVLPTLFEPFGSASRRRSRSEGLGLGLFLVQQLVAAHGGEVSVETRPEFGTRLRVVLPRSRARSGPASPASG